MEPLVECRPHRWRARRCGQGKPTLVLHGAGSSGQSFARVADFLADDHAMLIPDLPGHGQTRLGTKQRSGLAHMAEDVWSLAMQEIGRPELIVAHSAGAAIALHLAHAEHGPPVVAINPALRSFDGVAGWLFPLLAKTLGANPFAPQILARMTGRPARIKELLQSQGSQIDDEMVAHYRGLASDARHVAGTLAMMGQWSVEPLRRALPRIKTPVLFITGDNDRTVAPEVSVEAAGMMPNATLERLPGLGHLAHEEAPDRVTDVIRGWEDQISSDLAEASGL